MENDQVFAADADINPASRSQSRHLNHPAHRGHDNITAANGAIEAYKSNEYEDTPLLSRGVDEDYERRSENADAEQESEQTDWSGARDFEGRPWWNRPSASFYADPGKMLF